MRKHLIFAVLLSFVLYSSCDKKDVEPNSELIEVGFNATVYSAQFTSDLKALPGWPVITHLTDLNSFDGQIALGSEEDYYESVDYTVGQFDTISIAVEAGNWTLEYAHFSNESTPIYGAFSTELRYYYGSSTISSFSVPEPVIYAISNENSQIDFEIVASQSCYVFRDPDGLLEEITIKGNEQGTGILKSEMNTVVDQFDETFYYCYASVNNLWVYATDGTRLNLDFQDYYASLPVEEQNVYISVWPYTSAVQPQPFTVYTTVTSGGSTPSTTNVAFAVSSVYPNVEVEITLE